MVFDVFWEAPPWAPPPISHRRARPPRARRRAAPFVSRNVGTLLPKCRVGPQLREGRGGGHGGAVSKIPQTFEIRRPTHRFEAWSGGAQRGGWTIDLEGRSARPLSSVATSERFCAPLASVHSCVKDAAAATAERLDSREARRVGPLGAST